MLRNTRKTPKYFLVFVQMGIGKTISGEIFTKLFNSDKCVFFDGDEVLNLPELKDSKPTPPATQFSTKTKIATTAGLSRLWDFLQFTPS